MVTEETYFSSLIQRIKDKLEAIFPYEIEEKGHVKKFILRVGWICSITFKKFINDLCFEQAAGLAYITVISLIPLSVLFFSIAGAFGVGEEIINYVQDRVFPFVAPEFHEQLSVWLERYISPTAFRGIKSGIIGLIAIVSLLLASMAVFVMAERVFNHIWKVRERRSYFQKVIAFWVLLTTSPFLILTSIWFMNYLNPPGGVIDQLIQTSLAFRLLYNTLVPLAVSFLAFTLINIIVPSIHVKLKYAAVGGIASAILWEISKRGFYLYVGRIGHVTNFYKSLATIPLFLIWIYLTWVLILLGAQLAYTFQNKIILQKLHEYQYKDRFYSKKFLAVMILAYIGKAFRKGETVPTLDEISQKTGIQIEILDEVTNVLVQHDFLFPNTALNRAYFLEKDPRYIYLSDVIRCVHLDEYPAETRIFPGSGYRKASEKDPIMQKTQAIFSQVYYEMSMGLSKMTLDTLLNGENKLLEANSSDDIKEVHA
ncbi:MAG: YhjD/YihY/BrkB family envelope integrity protein [Candidatus Marinimicrobia bacterium]|nr:YhjD/YihY/BrkB family envelope integrity protein [Candidatus Neomarinimicrobiota bacterium]